MYRFILASLLITMSASSVSAGAKVNLLCAYDYIRHCSAYSTDSQDAKKCMADVGVNLSHNCIRALVDEGYITKEDVIARAAKEGVVVRDTDKGLVIDTNAKVGTETVTVVAPPKVETKVVTEEAVVEEKTPVIKKVYNTAKKKTSDSFVAVKKATKKVFYSAKKAVTKATVKVKKTYAKVKKTNIDEDAKHSYIDHWNNVVDGRNLTTGNYTSEFYEKPPRAPGYSKPPKQKSWGDNMYDRFNGDYLKSGF